MKIITTYQFLSSNFLILKKNDIYLFPYNLILHDWLTVFIITNFLKTDLYLAAIFVQTMGVIHGSQQKMNL